MQTKLVAYCRVTNPKQEESGFGLEGQTAVEANAASLNVRIIRAFQEVEIGRRADRPELLKAIAHAKRSGARLVIAKLDLLTRNVHFSSGSVKAGVDFAAIDNQSPPIV